MILSLLSLFLVSASDLEDQILTSINTDFSRITGLKNPHFILQAEAWAEFDTENSLVHTVFLLNNTDTDQLSLHFFEFVYESVGVIRLQHRKEHSSPPTLDLETTESGLILEAISNVTNSTIEVMQFLDEGQKQEIVMQPYKVQDPIHFALLSRQFVYQGNVYYAATFVNSTGERMHYLTYRNETSLYGTGGFAKSGSLTGVIAAFVLATLLTYAGLVIYWRRYDRLPWQKRKEESARVVLDSNRVKSSVSP